MAGWNQYPGPAKGELSPLPQGLRKLLCPQHFLCFASFLQTWHTSAQRSPLLTAGTAQGRRISMAPSRQALCRNFPAPQRSSPGRACSFGAVTSPQMLQYTPALAPFWCVWALTLNGAHKWLFFSIALQTPQKAAHTSCSIKANTIPGAVVHGQGQGHFLCTRTFWALNKSLP